MKITLGEWAAFNAAWTKADSDRNWYFDDQRLPDENEDGELIDGVDPSTKFDLTGFMAWQGEGEPRPSGFLAEQSLASAVRKWRKMSAFETRVIDIPKERFAEVQAALASFGIKIEDTKAR